MSKTIEQAYDILNEWAREKEDKRAVIVITMEIDEDGHHKYCSAGIVGQMNNLADAFIKFEKNPRNRELMDIVTDRKFAELKAMVGHKNEYDHDND